MNGIHIIAELYQCRVDVPALNEAAALETLCTDICTTHGLEIVGKCFRQFKVAGKLAGATGAVILAESHLAIHTWPELGSVTLDLYVCNFSRDNTDRAEAAFAALALAFSPVKQVRQTLLRGISGGNE